MNIKDVNFEERIEEAVRLFKSGYNCSQSVSTAFADLYNIEKETMLRTSASFGAGIGRMRETCGAACGMFILAGLENGSTESSDRKAKARNYQLVQNLAAKFKEKNGSLICGVLLGIKGESTTDTKPAERTADYYKKRPCVEIVRGAATIYAEYLQNKEAQTE